MLRLDQDDDEEFGWEPGYPADSMDRPEEGTRWADTRDLLGPAIIRRLMDTLKAADDTLKAEFDPESPLEFIVEHDLARFRIRAELDQLL